jgi:hypothetical protein
MRAMPVESSTLNRIAYDSHRQVLQIEFRDGSRYQYHRVPTELFDALLQATSKGAYFNQNIRGKFPTRQIPPAKSSLS